MVIIYYFDFSLLLKVYLKICVVCLLTVSGGWKSLRDTRLHLLKKSIYYNYF